MKLKNYYPIFVFVLIISGLNTYAQNTIPENLLRHLEEHKTDWQLTDADLEDAILTSQHTSQHNGVTHLYLRQTHKGIEVHNAVINANIMDDRILNIGSRFTSNLANQINSTEPSLSPLDAVSAAARALDLHPIDIFKIQKNTNAYEYEIDQAGIASAPIKVKLMYLPTEAQRVRLMWHCEIYTNDQQHYWQMSIDASTGKVLRKRDAVLHCEFGDAHPHAHPLKGCLPSAAAPRTDSPLVPIAIGRGKSAAGSYNVFPMPVESPIHGSRQVVTDPADAVASPFGWHDADGVEGAEFTFTRGNNVQATEDTISDGGTGYVAEGGSSLDFDFPLDLSLTPADNMDAVITNLFYWNNIMHDVWYRYGFDEASGNFQDNNYGNGGAQADYVMAEAQDGGGTNNANFFSGTDGTNGRMQMYLWIGLADESFAEVTSPASISGEYVFAGADFGSDEYMVSGTLVEARDASNNPTLVCEAIENTAEINGNIALIDRGACFFVDKVQNAENAGAIAVIVCNNVGGKPVTMGGPDLGISIPSVMFTIEDCATIRAELPNVEVTLNVETFLLDSGFDNGIVVHEYGHGISTRLTGGAAESDCLSSDWQMGEGWSDWFTLAMTAKADDQATQARSIGNYASNRGIDGVGIRRYPYSTDMAINPHTYAAIDTMAIPHGVGSVWCAMIWDMYWALVAQDGFDEDIYNGTGGNNIAMQLVLDGMKLQPCNPTFPEARDAILLADEVNNNSANQCLIWETFARRGLGNRATPGPIDNYELSLECATPTAPQSAFTSNIESCSGAVCFDDQSTNFPEQWNWNFGDGNSSTEQHPTHQYAQSGTYTVTLQTTNSTGTDTETKNAYIAVSLPQTPNIQYVGECENGLATLNASATEGTIQWLDGNNTLVAMGSEFIIQSQDIPETYYAQNVISQNSKAGPESRLIGNGTYHLSDFRGQVLFEAHQSFKLLSLLVDAGSEGSRVFDLEDSNGAVIQSVTVNLQAGSQRVDINWDIVPGTYSIAAQSVDLYRNDSGVSYPYAHCSGALTITGSPAQAGPDFYYYFYDWEIETTCVSEKAAVMVDCIVGITENSLVETFNIFPNPNTGTFDIELAGEAQKNIQLTVFDVLGQAIYQNDYNFLSGQLSTRLTLANLSAGTFFVKVSSGDRVSYQKIVVY